ncbi:MAG: lytic transglycosylase domain-containing protein, partial [Actinomycetota bacterium]
MFAFTAALTLVLVLIFTPDQVQVAVAASAPVGHLQSVEVNGSYTATIARDGYGVTKKLIAASTPAASVPAGEAQLIAYNMLISMGMGDDQFSCLVSLWNKESHWSTTAGNPVSGAYGIPQALPGSKMASAGPDWQTNATTQITWGLG